MASCCALGHSLTLLTASLSHAVLSNRPLVVATPRALVFKVISLKVRCHGKCLTLQLFSRLRQGHCLNRVAQGQPEQHRKILSQTRLEAEEMAHLISACHISSKACV